MIATEQTIIDAYLEEQQRLQTPVARFAGAHGAGPALAPVWRDLIPLSLPGPGEQFAFEVELDACTGCKACVSACHALNGLDEGEAWRDVGLLLGGTSAAPFQQTVTTACHHCAEPACLDGCPVLAYEKDPVTGIVRHLDDQCIGCQYCILKCPYDVPKYNARLGIVRKCDLCHQRLSAGEAPACVQACPTHAIRIVTVSTHRTGSPQAEPSAFLAAAPDPGLTQPTTRYVARRPLPANARAADADTLRPQPAHAPLAVMLTLLPGAILLQALLLTPLGAGAGPFACGLPAAAGLAGLAAATLHLGQPWRAWRVFLGLRRSWFSREAVLFGAWISLTLLAAARPATPAWLEAGAVLAGVAGLGCSVMIYVDTHRRFWRLSQTLPRFLGTGTVLALAVLAPALAAPVLGLKLAFEWTATRGDTVSARLLRGPLRRLLGARFALGGLALAALLAADHATRFGVGAPEGSVTYYVTLAVPPALVAAGEWLERLLFFRAVDAPKMPGLPGPGPAGATPA